MPVDLDVGAASAVLSVGGVELRGFLEDDGGLVFAPIARLDPDDAALIRRIGHGEVAWGESGTRWQLPVAVRGGRRCDEFELAEAGTAQRSQRRAAVRVRVELPVDCMVRVGNTVQHIASTTIDLSATGSALVGSVPDAALAETGPAPLAELRAGVPLGLVIGIDPAPILAAAQVVETFVAGARSGVRVQFTRMRRIDTDALAAFVMRAEMRRLG